MDLQADDMYAIQGRAMAIVICLSAISILISGCVGVPSPDIDMNTAAGLVLDATSSVSLAQDAGASEHAPDELMQAESFLAEAEELLKEEKSADAAEMAYRADMEAKIATAMAREAKAMRRAAEASDSKLKTTWTTMIDRVAVAEARRTIAENNKAIAEEDSSAAKAQAQQEIQRAKVELAMAKADLEMGLADELKASEYAEEEYSKASLNLQAARSSLDEDDFEAAVKAAEEAFKYAATARIQAKAKLEVEAEEDLRVRDRSVAAITKAELAVEEAAEDLSIQYAEKMHEEALETLREARVALQDKEYERAASLAEQARVSASSARAVVESRETETRTKEAQEDARANAMDAVAKAKRAIAQADTPEVTELAEEAYKKAKTALEQADQSLQDEEFDSAFSLAQRSIAYSTAALAMAEAMTANREKMEEIERGIMEAAAKIPESTVRRGNDGIIISMGGDLFAQGGSQIRNEAKARLKKLAELLKKFPGYRIIVEGHTDSTGSNESNLKVSANRAANFLKYMVDTESIPLDRLSSVGYGESHPIASNINEVGRRQNRRVDIVILTSPISP